MADGGQLPGEDLRRLYASWARGGVGLILSGNVMINPAALTGPGGVVLDERQPIEPVQGLGEGGENRRRSGLAADQPSRSAGFRPRGMSGGSYESPAMQGTPQAGGSAAREAYSLDFSRDISAVARMPVMVTGDIRRRAIAEQALKPSEGRPGVAMVGIASAFAFEPNLPDRWDGGEALDIDIRVGWRNKAYASLARMAVVKLQLRRLGKGPAAEIRRQSMLALIRQQIITKRRTRLSRAWVSQLRAEPAGA